MLFRFDDIYAEKYVSHMLNKPEVCEALLYISCILLNEMMKTDYNYGT